MTDLDLINLLLLLTFLPVVGVGLVVGASESWTIERKVFSIVLAVAVSTALHTSVQLAWCDISLKASGVNP